MKKRKTNTFFLFLRWPEPVRWTLEDEPQKPPHRWIGSETTEPNGFALLILLFLMDMIRRQWRHFRFSSTFSCSISNRLEKPKQTNRKECRELTSSNGERVLLPSRAMGPAADAISLFFSFPDPWTKVPLWLKGILRTRKKFFIFLEGTHSVCDVLDHKVKPPLSRPDDGRFEVGDLLP